MKTFNQFTNESLRNMMKGVDLNDIIKNLEGKSNSERYLFFEKYKDLKNNSELIKYIPTKEELINGLKDEKNTSEKIRMIYELGLENNLMSTINVIEGDLRWMGDGGDWEVDKKLILKDGITINGNLTVYHYFKDDKLPDNMTINGSLSLGMTNIIKMPKNLTVTGNIIAMDLDLYTLQNVNLGGKLYLEVTDEDNKLKDKIVLLYSNDSISFMDKLNELGIWV